MKKVYMSGGIYIPMKDLDGRDITLALYPTGNQEILTGEASRYASSKSAVCIPDEAFAVVYEALVETYFTGEE